MKKTFNFTLAAYLLTISTYSISNDKVIVLQPTVTTTPDKPTTLPPITATPSTPAPIPDQPSVPKVSGWVKVESTATTATAINPQTLANRSYYAMPADATCVANNDPKRTKLKTWRNKLSFNHKGQMLIWESICNDSPRLMAWSEIATGTLLITQDLSHISYKEEIFTYFATPPLLCPTGNWCPADKQ